MSKAIIEGYAPSDLIARVKTALWEPCVPSGRNFRGIEFGNRVLADAPDLYCPLKHRATIATIPDGETYIIEGYNFEDLGEGVLNGSLIMILGGYKLVDPPLHEISDLTAYRVTVETL